MKHRLGRLAAGILLVFAVLCAPAYATSATVRVEGNSVHSTSIVNTTGSGVPGNASCQINSAAEALDKATSGNWDRQNFASTILGETHNTYSADQTYWAFWINGSYSQTAGICDYIVQPGDEILLYPQTDNSSFMGTVWPLYFTGLPSSVVAGQTYTVNVIQRVADFSATTSQPAAGATVSDGATTATTDGSGHATFTAPSSGPVQLVATQPGHVKSPISSIAVTIPAAGASTAPSEAPAPTPTPVDAPVVPSQVAVADTQAPVTTIAGLRNRERFAKGKGPRELKGSVSDTGALKNVEVRLRRTSGRKCFGFNAKRETFAKLRCSADAAWFNVGSSADWSYLLPSRLAKGLYQLQVRATDAAGNRSTVQSLRFRVA